LSILIDSSTRVIVQKITGREGRFHTEHMLRYGTKIVAGIAPSKGGESVCGVPVYDSAKQALREHPADAVIAFVPANRAPDAIFEAADGGIPLIVCITEGIPTLDLVRIYAHVKRRGCRLVGPNCPGIISPGACKLGIMPEGVYSPGPVGVVARSGTLAYEVAGELTSRGIGQSTCVGIGGDPIVGSSFVDILRLFENDPATKAVTLIGEIGGSDEEEAAVFIAENMTKPVAAFIAGRTAPPEKRMGHAGAIISSGRGMAEEKITALRAAGVIVADTTEELGARVAELLRTRPAQTKRKDAGGA
jgi:succinyl-CoA synthetase alpha subunit